MADKRQTRILPPLICRPRKLSRGKWLQRMRHDGAERRAKKSTMSNGGGRGETRLTVFLSKIPIVKRGMGAVRAAPIDVAQSQQHREGGHESVRTTTITHVGDGVEDETRPLGSFIRKVSTTNSALGPVARRARGASTGQVVGYGGKRNSQQGSSGSGMGDGLSIEEIRGVRDRCKRMVGAAAAAGAVGTWVDARKALLATVFETHPNLDETDLDKYLVIRDLEKSEEVDPERIRELAVALFLLTRKQSLSFENVVRIAYHIFDEDGDGEMSKEEFQQLMKATLRTHLTLDFVLRLPAGKAAFLRHLKEEYAEENFYFWQSTEQFASSLPTVAKAQTLYDGYIREGAPKQVNISAATNEGIRQKWQSVQLGEAPLTRKLFSAAQAEVFNLMQRDNFERFRQNPKSMEDFVNRVFTEVDRSGNGTISLEEYMEWASNNREVMRFMRGAGGQVAVIRTLPQGNDLSGLVSAGGRRTLRAIATRGIKKLRGTRVVVVRSDSTSVNSSSSSSSCPSPTQYWAGGGSDCGGNGRRRQGDNGSKGGGIAGDASGGRIGANDDRMGPATVAEAAAAGDGRASRRRHSSSATNRSGRIACSGGQGNDNGLRKEQGDRSYRGRAGGGKTGNGSEHARVIDGRGRIQPMLAFHLLVRVIERSTQWVLRRKRNRSSAKALGV